MAEDSTDVVSALRALGQHPGITVKGQRVCEAGITEIERLRSVALAARALVQSVQPSLDADLEVVSESKLTELESMLEMAGFGEE